MSRSRKSWLKPSTFQVYNSPNLIGHNPTVPLTPIVSVALHGPEQRAACPRILRDAGLLGFDLDGKLFDGSAPSDEIYALPGPMSGLGG